MSLSRETTSEPQSTAQMITSLQSPARGIWGKTVIVLRGAAQVEAVFTKQEKVFSNNDDTRVYKVGYQTQYFHKTVALKQIGYTADTLADCEQEKNVMEALFFSNAQNIVLLEGHFKTKRYYYLVMEYTPCDTLWFDIQSYVSTWPYKYDLMLSITLGLHAMHEREILHRDIKTTNILIFEKDNEECYAKLTDFDLSEKVDAVHHYYGSYNYLPPEVCLKQAITKKSDIYSLGQVFWAMAEGDEPYSEFGSDMDKIEVEIVNGRTSPIDPAWPAKISALIKWCWLKPEHRPTTAELIQELSTGIDKISENLSMKSSRM